MRGKLRWQCGPFVLKIAAGGSYVAEERVTNFWSSSYMLLAHLGYMLRRSKYKRGRDTF